MAVVAMSILAVLIFLLTGSGGIFTDEVKIRTFMSDSAAMTIASPVRLNGIVIGQISDIRFTGSNEPGRVVEIEMEIEKKYISQIPEDSEAGVSAANLLGDKFINITKGRSAVPVKPGGALKALEVQDIPQLMTRAGDLLGGLQVSLQRVDRLLADVEAGRGNIGKILRDEKLYESVVTTVDEARRAIAALNTGKGMLARLLHDDELYQDLRRPINRLDALLEGMERGEGTAGKLIKDPAMYNEIRSTIAEVRRVVDDLNAGKGTAGRLLKDEALYKQISQMVAKVDTTVDKVNSGQGTLGQLLVNPQLYESLNGATREAHALVKDIRANPKKFLRIKLAIF